MPLDVADLPLPSRTADIAVGDTDGDGRNELVVAATQPSTRKGEPVGVTLRVVWFDDAGRPSRSKDLPLGQRPAFWTLSAGLWLVDGGGLSRLDPQTGASTRVLATPTVLQGLGATSPMRADLAHDLDGDGKEELLVPTRAGLEVLGGTGRPMGSVPWASTGAVASAGQHDGVRVTATVRTPEWKLADVDGDGRVDVLLPARDRLQVYYTGDNVAARAATLSLPLDLDPPEEPFKATGERRTLAGVWFEDLDGDHRVDLAIQRFVTSAGSFFGATAELSWAFGTGSGFGPLTSVRTPAAAFAIEIRDLDLDGRPEWLAREGDATVGNIARAILAKAVRVTLTSRALDGGTYPATGTTIRTFDFPLQPVNRFQEELGGDVDGDGHLDLVTNDAADRVRVYRGVGRGFVTTPTWEAACPVPLASGALVLGDLTGDRGAEIVVWGPNEAAAKILHAR